MNPRGLTDVMCNWVRCKCSVGILIVCMVCTFNPLTLMFRHGHVMLQLKNVLIAGVVEITFVFYNGNTL